MFRENLLPYWWMLYRHSKILNQRTDIFRNVEDAFAVKHAEPCLSANKVYLDIGSGSSLIPTFLYQRHRALTYATEFDEAHLESQSAFGKTLGFTEDDNFVVQTQDATRLSFLDGSVDFITVISTIEHIPGDGDTRAMAEFERVMPTGGRLVVTVPASASYMENESTYYYPGFERRYDPDALQNRLFRQGLKVVEQLYLVPAPSDFMKHFNESFAEILHGETWNDAWYKNLWHDQYPDISILLTMGFVRLSPNPSGAFGACLAFEKK